MILYQGTIDLVLQCFTNLHILIAYHHIIVTWMPNLQCKKTFKCIILHSMVPSDSVPQCYVLL